ALPIPGLVLTAALGLVHALRLKYLLLKSQPMAGRKIVYLNVLTRALNLLASAGLSLVMAGAVHLSIADYFYLFLFNSVFCFLVSARWFDFGGRIFRGYILKWSAPRGALAENEREVFVMLLGLRNHTGIGWGMAPVFLDAGFLRVRSASVFFHGILSTHDFAAETLLRAEKKSFERIRIFPARPVQPHGIDAFLIVVRDRFYPFKSKPARDEIHQAFAERIAMKPAQAGLPAEPAREILNPLS
ncbi:MAG: hypothetical protein HZA02_08110, partial [Nitrospinae bacterium]|nr:hypothetical protein [Nitrospinota bacterium]